MTKLIYRLLLAVSAFSFMGILSERIPKSPCPKIFRYKHNSNGVDGIITIPYHRSDSFTLTVNASMNGFYGKEESTMELTMETPMENLFDDTARTLTYRLQFPRQDSLPKITDIILNGRRFCSGPSHQLYPGTAVTNMFANHVARISAETVVT